MGYQTDYVGYFDIVPPLGEQERQLVNRISGSLLVDGERGTGLRVADAGDQALRDLLGRSPHGWSNWIACPLGCCLSYDGGDKANHMIPWLTYLMRTFLVPGAEAEGLPGLTRDHLLTGVVVGSRRDNGELFAIRACDNEVEVEMLWRGNREWSTYAPLRYHEEIDRFREWLAEYRRRA